MKKIALILAGGSGERMKSKIRKQFLPLNGMPVLMHTITHFLHFDKIILVLPKSEIDFWKRLCLQYNFTAKHTIIEGGKSRFHSVKNGLEKTNNNSIVAIHDGVRPIISKKLITLLISKTGPLTGSLPVLAITSSLRKIKGEDSKHINRKNLYQTQTPQCFRAGDIKKAYSQRYSAFFTDDASVFEKFGGKIITVLGERKNLKITTEEDLKIAELFMQ